MGDARPLAGKRVVVTRAAEQSSEFIRQLEELGAEVVSVPVVRYAGPIDDGPLQQAIADLATFHWLIFTSQNAVRFFSDAARRVTEEMDGVRRPRVAVVGPATADAARKAGWNVAYVATRFEGSALAAELGERVRGCKVLLPRSDRAGTSLPGLMRTHGAAVTEVIAYRTVDAELKDSEALGRIRSGHVDAITFASPSAFHALARAVGSKLQEVTGRIVLAAIGPVTADAMKAEGFPVHVMAEESTSAALATALANYFERQRESSGARR